MVWQNWVAQAISSCLIAFTEHVQIRWEDLQSRLVCRKQTDMIYTQILLQLYEDIVSGCWQDVREQDQGIAVCVLRATRFDEQTKGSLHCH